jgi:hypothetical protein
MFTDNYTALQKARMSNKDQYVVIATGEKFLAEYFRSYNQYDIGRVLTKFAAGPIPEDRAFVSESSFGVRFGSGDTPARRKDYKLDALITSGLSAEVGTVQYYEDADGNYVIENTFVVTNTGSNAIDIKEAGLFGTIYNVNSTKYHAVMVHRFVLDEPVTLMPGVPRMITYRFTFNQFLNVEEAYAAES